MTLLEKKIQKTVTNFQPRTTYSRTNGKWRVEKSGEDQAIIDLKLKKLSKICSISIGAHACAFVSVRVSAPTSAKSLLSSLKSLLKKFTKCHKDFSEILYVSKTAKKPS